MSKRIPQEFRYRLGNLIQRERLNHGYLTVEDLAQAAHIPVCDLMS